MKSNFENLTEFCRILIEKFKDFQMKFKDFQGFSRIFAFSRTLKKFNEIDGFSMIFKEVATLNYPFEALVLIGLLSISSRSLVFDRSF